MQPQPQPPQPNLLTPLFTDPSTKQTSQYHLTNHILLNPTQLPVYLSKGSQVLKQIAKLLNSFPLNYVHISCSIDIFDVLFEEILENAKRKEQSKEAERGEREKALLQLFEGFLLRNDVPLNVFKNLNRRIVREYYAGGLDQRVFETGVDLVRKMYQKMLGAVEGKQGADSFIYLLSAGDELRIELSNQKWPFAKGMCVKAWIHPESCESKKQAVLWLLKTEDKKEMEIKLVNEELFFTLSKAGKPQAMIQVGTIKPDCWSSFSIQLQPAGGFTFGGHNYHLNIKFNQNSLMNINVQLPKFSSSELITDLILFRNFVGRVSWVLVTNIAGKEGPAYLSDKDMPRMITEPILHDMLSKDILKRENVVVFYLPSRSYCGLLLNVLGNQTNNGVFTGYVNNPVSNTLKQFREFDPVLPYYWLNRFIDNKEKKSVIFNKLLTLFAKAFALRPEYSKYFLFITYFCISDNYQFFDNQTMIIFEQLRQKEPKTIGDSLSQMSLEHIIKIKLDIPESLKITFRMPTKHFYQRLQSEWEKMWAQLQSFSGFWSHPQFKYQRNDPFKPEAYIYSPNKKSFYQWTISNFVTKQWSRPLLQPIFIQPPHTTNFLIELDSQDSHQLLQSLNKPQQLAGKQITLQRIPSKTQKLKSLLSKSSLLSNASKEESKKSEPQWGEYETDCLWINHLTVVLGVLTINYGEIIFTSAHMPRYDHMAICNWRSKEIFTLRWKVEDVEAIKKRRYNQSRSSIELFLNDTSSYVFYLVSKDVDKLLSKLPGAKIYKTPLEHFTQSHKPDDWIDRKISNFQYFMWLNFVSGRSYQDLTQYPVVPWIFIGFQSNPDLNALNNYRDLSKNMGTAGAQSRKKYFIQKYQSKNEYQLVSQYHYGTHYSSSAIICNFLIRLKPYSDGAMSLQSGKFDVADRVFAHYEDSWHNATTSPSDVRELIPDFYVLPQLFINVNNYDFGMTQNKERIDNVVLPKWSKQNPYYFVSVLRKAVESEYVSKSMSGWVDLIYGYKQRGKEAITEMNIFYHLTYQDSLDLDSVPQQAQRLGFESQIAHFGQTPSQIISNHPHPVRAAPNSRYEGRLLSDGAQARIMKNLDKHDMQRNPPGVIFNSVLEHPYSIMRIKFYKEDMYAMFKRQHIGLYKIGRNQRKEIMITKEETVKYQIENAKHRLDIRSLQNCANLPVQYIPYLKAFIIGGYYFGYTNLIFYTNTKQNQFSKLASCTITSLALHSNTLFCGTLLGQLFIYNFNTYTNVSLIQDKFDHQAKISDISIASNQNMFCTCSDDSKLLVYNLFSYKLLRRFENPSTGGILWARISSTPLFGVVFYSPKNTTVYSYSINGQYLMQYVDQSELVLPPCLARDSKQLEALITINANKTVTVFEMPFLDIKRKIQLKKNETPRISCFECSDYGLGAVVGTIQGHAYIVMDPDAF